MKHPLKTMIRQQMQFSTASYTFSRLLAASAVLLLFPLIDKYCTLNPS
jgi:predicted double-glycine peptidase